MTQRSKEILLPSRESFRDSRHYVTAVASEIAAPALRLIARAITGGPTPTHEWRRALIVGHGHIGDVLCQTVSLATLTRGLPNCRFDYLTTTLAAEVLAGNPALEHVLPWNSSSNPSSLKPEHVVALRNSRYDAILCTNVVRHQEAVGLAFTLRIPNRVAFIHRGLSGLVTLPVTLAAPTNPPAQSRAMAAAVTGLKDDSELRPRIFLSQADRMEAEAEWERLGLRNTDLIATCSVTTRQIIGKVPSSFFADALQSLHAIAPGARIILTGSHDDADTLSSMAAKLGGHVAVSAGRLSVRGFAAFLERSSVHFCMDSGPRHLANAVGTPVVFVRNLSVRAAEAGAYCPSEMDVMPYADYLTPDQASRTLSEVEPSAVATAILRQAGERASTIPR